MATSKYPNSNKETIPTMMFSIEGFSHLLAQADIDAADDEERHDDSDVNEIFHSSAVHLSTIEPAPVRAGGIIKRGESGVKKSSKMREGLE